MLKKDLIPGNLYKLKEGYNSVFFPGNNLMSSHGFDPKINAIFLFVRDIRPEDYKNDLVAYSESHFIFVLHDNLIGSINYKNLIEIAED